jgi:sec-independent protein translocase protein TatC
VTDVVADDRQPILAHLEEFRWRIVKISAAVLGAALIALLFANRIRLILEAPYEQVCGDSCQLQSLTATEQFSVLMKVAFFGGFVIASPVVLYQIWAFINPALTSREKKWAVPIIGACVVLFTTGIAFGYWILPRGLEFLLGIFPDVESNLRIGDYFSFVVRFLLAFGGSFLYPVFLFAAAAAGLVTSAQLAGARRWAILIIVVVAAGITPTGDALTLTMLSVPLYLFYEVTYWLVRLLLRK